MNKVKLKLTRKMSFIIFRDLRVRSVETTTTTIKEAKENGRYQSRDYAAERL